MARVHAIAGIPFVFGSSIVAGVPVVYRTGNVAGVSAVSGAGAASPIHRIGEVSWEPKRRGAS
jgi:hypothetical protein